MTLPKEYKGYTPKELISLWDRIHANTAHLTPEPESKVLAMDRFLYEYKLAPVFYRTKEEDARAKAILAEIRNS